MKTFTAKINEVQLYSRVFRPIYQKNFFTYKNIIKIFSVK